MSATETSPSTPLLTFPDQMPVSSGWPDFDWSKTPLGPPEQWPEALRAAVADTLADRTPAPPEPWQNSDANFRAFFELAAIGAAQCDVTTRRLVRVNHRLCQMLGYTAAELCGTPFIDLTHPDDRPANGREFERLLGGEIAEFTLEKRLLRRDGAPLWVTVSAALIRGADGRALGTTAVIQDISARKAAEAALRESKERFYRALQIETVGVVFFRPDGGITDVNDTFLRLSGYAREDVRAGRVRFEDVTPSEGCADVTRAAEEFEALGRSTPREKECRRKDGTRWRGLYAATRISENEGVVFVIDVTDARRAENELRRYRQNLELQVQQRTAELDAANGTLRDEILERRRAEGGRQELLRLLVNAQEAERSRISRELHDEVGQHVTSLLLGLKSLETAPGAGANAPLIKKLQATSELIGKEVHELALELRPSALDDLGLLGALSNYVDEWSARSGIAVDVHTAGFTADRLPPEIETTLYRIVQEALNNVLKHARAQRVSLILERNAEHAAAIVEDNGRGFKVDALRTAAAGKRLGLLGMGERAALAGGAINIESEPGRGTTIFARIPLRRPEHPLSHA